MSVDGFVFRIRAEIFIRKLLQALLHDYSLNGSLFLNLLSNLLWTAIPFIITPAHLKISNLLGAGHVMMVLMNV